MDSANDMSIPESKMTENPKDNLDMMPRDPLKIVTANEGEILIKSVHASVTHLGSELQGHSSSTDRDNKTSVSDRDCETLVASVPQFDLDGRNIVVFSDVCQVVLKTWGSYNNLYNLLKKQGITTCRFNQSQLRMLKNIGVFDKHVKNCSFITQEDFIQILHKYDEEYNTDQAKHIQLSTPVVINTCNHNSPTNFQENQCEKKQCLGLLPDTNASDQSSTSSLHNIYTFSIGNQDFVTLSEVNNLFETCFDKPDLLNQILQNLKIAVGKFTANELTKVEIDTGVTCNNSLRRLYITKKDFQRVLQYSSAFLDTNPPVISWLQLGKLSVSVGARKGNINKEDTVPAGLMSNSSSTASMMAHIPENNFETVTGVAHGHVVLGTEASNAVPNAEPENSSASETASTNNGTPSCVIRTCLVNGEKVVSIPDLHKVVIDLYGQSVQVSNYMHRLKIPTHRFSSIFLKRLKAHNILSSKATLCTYITKMDAERLLKYYHMCNHWDNRSDNLPRIEWGEPIILENIVNKASEDQVESLQNQRSVEAELKIPLLMINHQVVVSMPDVHRAVQLLNGQSVQLRYNLDKLGIVKHKYSYSDVHQLKVLGHINRPSSCTYITKADVDMLLQFYTTPENEDRLKLIEWQQPIIVERLKNISDSISSPEIDNDNNTDVGQTAKEYSISDLYQVFVVDDDVESIQSSSNDADDNQREKINQVTSSHLSLSSPSILSFLPHEQHTAATPDSRVEVNSINNQLHESTAVGLISTSLSSMASSLVLEPTTTISSHMSASEQPCVRSDGAVNHEVANVNQMQVDVYNRNVCDPVRSTRNRPAVASPKGVSNQTYNQAMYHSPSSCTIVPDSNMTHTNSTGSIVHSACATAAGRDGQMPLGSDFTSYHGHRRHSSKRPNENSASHAMWLEQQSKRYRANDEDVLKTLQRKETEMKILHDAYQVQIKQEREHRLVVQRELDQLKDSNTELLKNIERKELEMKILHDSYKLQMDLERKKCEEREIEVLQLRDKLAASANIPRVKQEPP